MISIIIPFYNEEQTITACLESLSHQTAPSLEIILVDDGSTDNSKLKVQNAKSQFKIQNLRLLSQSHLGPAKARNLAASEAKGEILVFLDADMTFDHDFIKKLTEPIRWGELKGTFTKEEYVSNWNNIWARCWNYNEGISTNRRIPEDYPSTSPVFRAIRKDEFLKVEGFDPIGFTDDWTLSRKLGYQAYVTRGAICYHKNPQTLDEVYAQARWIGKNEFISGNLARKLISLVRYNPLIQTPRGLLVMIKHLEPKFLIFLWVYYSGIWVSVLKSFRGEPKNK